MKLRRIFIFTTILLCSVPLIADDGQHHPAGEKMGTLSFPTSCSPAVQKSFESGVAALHSFEYEVAEKQFHEVQQKDASCAMAYWGEAMSLYHQLWSRPTPQDLKRGAELLVAAGKLKASPGEQSFITALSVFYRDSEKTDHMARAKAYSDAMAKVYQSYPQDTEAAVFYALSLLSSSPVDDPELTSQRKAIAILNKVFAEHPNHPGIAHYIIHSTDNPQLASLGLGAARRYASIAPSSPHAMHMPSHIFARLGLWQDSIESNTGALRVADTMTHLHMAHHRMHSLDFLEYAYLQIGNDQQAKVQIDKLAQVRKEDLDDEFRDYRDAMVAGFAARYAIERRQWKEAAELKADGKAMPSARAITYLANTIGAGHLRDKDAARTASQQFDAMIEEQRKSSKPYYVKGMENGQKEGAAWRAFAEGKDEEALGLMRSVADKQDKIGKGETEMPAREMLADMLLELKRPEEALKEFEVSLKTDPNRFNGLYGAAQAAEQSQQKSKSDAYYAQLLKNCQNVDSDRPELSRARTLVATK
jgi:tetratricopeptide (TPR) repeat protein